MRSALVGAALLPLAVTAYALFPPPRGRSAHVLHADNLPPNQQPISPGPFMPQPPNAPQAPVSGPPSSSGGPQGAVILSDVMGRDRSINIFAGLVRDVETAAGRLDDAGRNSTVLAPRNGAVEALPRKPWEDPDDYGRLGADAYEGDDGRERARRNVRRFVEAHVVPLSPWPAGERARTMDGGEGEIWWEEKEGKKVVSIYPAFAKGGMSGRLTHLDRYNPAISRWIVLQARCGTVRL